LALPPGDPQSELDPGTTDATRSWSDLLVRDTNELLTSQAAA